MLRTFMALESMSIQALDGPIGNVRDTYFDDETWTVRYLVVDTGTLLGGRSVLVTPHAVGAIESMRRRLEVDLTLDEVRNSPGIDADEPLSRQHETAYFDYYGYPYYWAGAFRWGPTAFPPPLALRRYLDAAVQASGEQGQQRDPHLRSAAAVIGYHLEAIDGPIGHVEDFLYDAQDWSLQSVVVDTRNWLPGRHVVVAVDWIERVSWDERKVFVGLTRGAVRQAPQWDAARALTPEYERYLLRFDRKNHSEPVRRPAIVRGRAW